MSARQRFGRLSREAFWIVFGQAMTVCGALVGVRLLTELLTPSAYGALALGLTVAMLINQTAMTPLGNGVARFYAPALELNQLSSYLRAVRHLVWGATGVIGAVAGSAFTGLALAGRSDWLPLAIPAVALAVLTGYNAILSALQNAARQRAVVALHTATETWLRFLLAAAFVLWFGGRDTTALSQKLGMLTGWNIFQALPFPVFSWLPVIDRTVLAMIGYACAALVVNGSQYLFLRRLLPSQESESTHEASWRSQIRQFSLPFAFFGLFSWGQQASDRWALQHFAMTADVGRYAVLFQLGYYPIALANGMARQLLAPIFYQRAGDGGNSQRTVHVNRLTWMLTGTSLTLTALACLLAIQYHVQIFRFLVAEEYRSVSVLLPWIMLASGLFSAGETRLVNIMSQLRTHLLTTPKIATSLVAIGGNILGAAYYGTLGVVAAGLIFSVAYFTWMAIITRHIKPSGPN